MRGLVLSLFPGIGMLDRAFSAAHQGEGPGKRRVPTVTSTEGGRRYSEKRVGDGKALHPMARCAPVTSSDGSTVGMSSMRRYKLAEACRLQGLPEDFLADAPFTAEGKLKAVANGVPIALGRALASSIRESRTGGA